MREWEDYFKELLEKQKGEWKGKKRKKEARDGKGAKKGKKKGEKLIVLFVDLKSTFDSIEGTGGIKGEGIREY